MKCIACWMFLLFVAAATATAQKDYHEPYRPQVHFSPKQHWTNDPNGMVYYKGIYHLFFQYYPGASVWGPMHWGHATSKDLIHWKQQPVALYPDKLGYIFSGSAVVD
ncbi:MAG TPA: levanase, partial [Chitinophagaceae bacterium]|nr:levanase [Chitinophagaceae bacterium]